MDNNNISIYDVAKKAGVSIATVSRVINGVENVKEVKKKAVEDAIKELGYVPSDSARRLAGNPSGLIGISLSFEGMEGTYISEFLRGAIKRLEKTSYSIVLINDSLDELDKEEPVALKYMQKKSIDALILTAINNEFKNEKFTSFLKNGFPVAYSGEYKEIISSWPNVFSVNGKRDEYLFESMELFYRKGHKKVGMYLFDTKPHIRIFNSAKKRFEEKYGKVLEVHIIYVDMKSFDYNFQEKINEMTEMLIEKKCTGILTLSKNQGISIIKSLSRKGFKVPQDYSIITIDWENGENDIDSIKIFVSEFGYECMDILIKCLSGEKDLLKKTLLDHEFVEMGSVLDINM